MELLCVRHLWGVDLSGGIGPYLPRWRAAGYGALESSLRFLPSQEEFFSVLSGEGWGWIPQVFTDGFAPDGSLRTPVGPDVDCHVRSLREQVAEAMPHKPMFFNAHSGLDAWSPAQAEEFFGRALEIEREYGVVISHETHRQRYFATPWATHAILNQFPALRLTCDFSHWVCVCERLLQDFGETLSLAASHCHHLHARVGFEEGPQVPDPRAPEYQPHLEAHEAWWREIWESQRARGMAVSTLTPEFGPPPYLHTRPGTGEPLADLADVCDGMAARQRDAFARFAGV